jgi:hypothetical protein
VQNSLPHPGYVFSNQAVVSEFESFVPWKKKAWQFFVPGGEIRVSQFGLYNKTKLYVLYIVIPYMNKFLIRLQPPFYICTPTNFKFL